MKNASIALLTLLTLGGISAEAATLEWAQAGISAEASTPVMVPNTWIGGFKTYPLFKRGVARVVAGVTVNDIRSVTVTFTYGGTNRLQRTMTLVIKDTPSLRKAQRSLDKYSPSGYEFFVQKKS